MPFGLRNMANILNCFKKLNEIIEMSLLKRLIKYPVVAPTISSLIILGILELTGYLPTAWNWLRVAFLMVRDLLMAAIPVWIVIAIGFTVWLLKKLLKKKNQSQPQTTKITDLE